MSALWSAEQREWLQAMGHSVMKLASDKVEEVPVVEREASAPVAQVASTEAVASAPRSEPARPVAPARASGADSALLRAVLRAARRGADDPAVLALFDAQALRGDAAAKRALWPQLRALRRGSAAR
ncbi:hypothetical protein [Lysobacter sp. 22409]|uniref:hypothetical protein n=1 Tax=Lysobacter sp. 22409 TaxID=3453917 RepID=UPI003F868F3A